ncbi:unnamed protein product [Caenorhabditis nigoni]
MVFIISIIRRVIRKRRRAREAEMQYANSPPPINGNAPPPASQEYCQRRLLALFEDSSEDVVERENLEKPRLFRIRRNLLLHNNHPIIQTINQVLRLMVLEM